MIKRTPQEIADFFGCYVTQNYNGDWFVHIDKPVMHRGAWVSHTGIGFPNQMVEAPDDHDWEILYEPRDITPKSGDLNRESGKNCQKSDLYPYLPDSGISAKSYCPDSKDSGSKDSAPHQSQVHTHQEYQVIADPDASNLFSRVNRLLADGWRPQGGIAVEHIDGENDSGYILYQAMVRGLQQ